MGQGPLCFLNLATMAKIELEYTDERLAVLVAAGGGVVVE